MANVGLKSGDEAAQKAKTAGVWATRIGFAMRALLYTLIGIVTLYIGCGTGKSGSASQKGAVQMMAGEPFGMVMLVLVIIGFIGMGLWLLSLAIRGTNKETGWKAVFFRVKCLIKSIINFVLAAYAIQIVSDSSGSGGSGGSGGSSMKQTWTGKLMQNTGGRIVLGVIGAIIVGVAISQFKKAWTAKFMEDLGIESLRGRKRKFVLIAGRVGHAARGLILTLVGIGVIISAATSDASEAKGIDGTLREVASYPGGKFVLIFMAVGFWCFAVFQLACAMWAKIE